MKALVVGNEEIVSKTVADLLEFLGCTAVQVRYEEIPDCVADFDLAMVDLGYTLCGKEAIAQIRSRDAQIGVVLLSSRASEKEAKGYGADLLLTKPFDLSKMWRAISVATATKVSMW